MKKSLFMCLLLAVVCMIGMGSCTGCTESKEEKAPEVGLEQAEKQAVQQLQTAMDVIGPFYVEKSDAGELVPERVMAINRQWMWLNQSKDYVWFETEVEYNKSLTDSTQTGEVKQVHNVFQKVTQIGKGFQVTVWQTYTNKAGTVYKYDNDFWMEDYNLNEVVVKLTFKDAYDRLMEANIPKPDSRFCVLRIPITPDAKPMYLFGNEYSGIVAVDANTGKVYSYLGGSLGERS